MSERTRPIDDAFAVALAGEIVRLIERGDRTAFIAGNIAKGETITVDAELPMIWFAQGIVRFTQRWLGDAGLCQSPDKTD